MGRIDPLAGPEERAQAMEASSSSQHAPDQPFAGQQQAQYASQPATQEQHVQYNSQPMMPGQPQQQGPPQQWAAYAGYPQQQQPQQYMAQYVPNPNTGAMMPQGQMGMQYPAQQQYAPQGLYATAVEGAGKLRRLSVCALNNTSSAHQLVCRGRCSKCPWSRHNEWGCTRDCQ